MDIFGYRRIINYIFPVIIYDRGDKLSIEDRRPSYDLLFTILGFFACIAFAVTMVPTFIADSYYPAIGLLSAVALYLIYRLLTRFFREIYVFDKSTNTFHFFRQSVLKKVDMIEGDLRQFQAVQVERTTTTNEGTTYKYFRVALLLGNELLLGRSSTQHFRETPPLFSYFETEARIAKAISAFLNIRNDGRVDVASFGPPSIGF